MKFLIDAQLPPALAAWLTRRGHQADHITEAKGLGVTDAEIWDLARKDSCIIVTKDRDFAIWARARRQGLKSSGSGWAMPAGPIFTHGWNPGGTR